MNLDEETRQFNEYAAKKAREDRERESGHEECPKCQSPNTEADARLIAAAPDLLALAHQYASECGECAGTRVCPDDAPCTECGFIWDVINKAEGKS